MKIVCDKAEFAMLIRNCWYDLQNEDCQHCWFAKLCSQMNAISDKEIMQSIEDLCVIEGGE